MPVPRLDRATAAHRRCVMASFRPRGVRRLSTCSDQGGRQAAGSGLSISRVPWLVVQKLALWKEAPLQIKHLQVR